MCPCMYVTVHVYVTVPVCACRVPREDEDGKLGEEDRAASASPTRTSSFTREDVSLAARLGKQALLSALK
jgi:hypothetical protein